METKTNEATKIINFIHRANRTNYNGLEARESDICSFIEREVELILASKDKEKEDAFQEGYERGLKAEKDISAMEIEEAVKEERERIMKWTSNNYSRSAQPIYAHVDLLELQAVLRPTENTATPTPITNKDNLK